jgi:hypothetical protein
MGNDRLELVPDLSAVLGRQQQGLREVGLRLRLLRVCTPQLMSRDVDGQELRGSSNGLPLSGHGRRRSRLLGLFLLLLGLGLGGALLATEFYLFSFEQVVHLVQNADTPPVGVGIEGIQDELWLIMVGARFRTAVRVQALDDCGVNPVEGLIGRMGVPLTLGQFPILISDTALKLSKKTHSCCFSMASLSAIKYSNASSCPFTLLKGSGRTNFVSQTCGDEISGTYLCAI